jgi:hypothetical protein
MRTVSDFATVAKAARDGSSGDEAQDSIAAHQKESGYLPIRTWSDDFFIWHPSAGRIGQADPARKWATGDCTPRPKLVGVLRFETWGGMPGTGFYTDDIDRVLRERQEAAQGSGSDADPAEPKTAGAHGTAQTPAYAPAWRPTSRRARQRFSGASRRYSAAGPRSS